MHINSIYNYNLYNNSLSFSSTNRNAKGQDGVTHGGTVWNTTALFRDDMSWNYLASFMDSNFKNNDKVNVYNLACSDGSEPYTLAIALDKQIPRLRRNKFLPIIASDVDSAMIRMARGRKINLDTKEIRYWLGDNESYFEKISDFPEYLEDDKMMQYCKTYMPNAYLCYAVEFIHNDILTEFSNINDNGNSVVLCRNVWPYLTRDYVEQAVKMLNEKLKTGSLLILGNYDNQSNVMDLIKDTFENKFFNVFRKI